jgi:hypothetical protein
VPRLARGGGLGPTSTGGAGLSGLGCAGLWWALLGSARALGPHLCRRLEHEAALHPLHCPLLSLLHSPVLYPPALSCYSPPLSTLLYLTGTRRRGSAAETADGSALLPRLLPPSIYRTAWRW